MLPQSLDEWNLDRLRQLLANGYKESEHFDLKEMLPHKESKKDKLGLRKDCCAFANAEGGFLVFGVKDDTRLPVEDRLEGITDPEFLTKFGSYPSECNPSIQWASKNPPIALHAGRSVHVIHIPRSWNGPHCTDGEKEGFIFSKRTSKGTEAMSYEEVRMGFLGYYEKRLKLVLLTAELASLMRTAQSMTSSEFILEDVMLGMHFDLTVINSVLVETFTILADDLELIATFYAIRERAAIVKDRQEVIKAALFVQMVGVDKALYIKQHNQVIVTSCQEIVAYADKAVGLLKRLVAAK